MNHGQPAPPTTTRLIAAAALVLAGIAGGREPARPATPDPLSPPMPPTPIPEPLPSPPGMDDTEDDAFFNRSYAWLFNEQPFRKSGREHSFRARLAIPKSVYEDFQSRPHTLAADAELANFAVAELDDEVVTAVAARLRALVVQHDLDRLGEIHLAMAFTLSLKYAYDIAEHGGEYPKFPVEMLVDKRGDCEDHAILCGAALHRLGHRVALVVLDTGPSTAHAALAVEAPEPMAGVSFYSPEMGTEMFYCEVTPGDQTTETTTAVQWWLGMEPPTSASDPRLASIAQGTRKGGASLV